MINVPFIIHIRGILLALGFLAFVIGLSWRAILGCILDIRIMMAWGIKIMLNLIAKLLGKAIISSSNNGRSFMSNFDFINFI
jgi:hypothetical protein